MPAVPEVIVVVPIQLLEQAKKGQEAALVAIRQVVDSVDGVLPDLTPSMLQGTIPARSDVIDAAFDLAEKVTNAGHGLATLVITTTGDKLGISTDDSDDSDDSGDSESSD